VIEPILAAVIPVPVTVGLGYLWVRSGRPFENAMLTPLVVDIGTPSLIFSTFVKISIPAATFASIAVASMTALKLPLIYAVLLGVGVSVWHVPLPSWAINTISLVGGMAIPLMLLMLGASLARLQVVAMSRAVILSLLRIGLGAGIGVVIAFLFHLEPVARSVLVMQCAMPVAVYNYLFAQKWNNQPEEVASLVVISTVGSVLTVPALLHFLMF
jgi:predicted permease